MKKPPFPFDFILDYLHPLPVTVKPMFGCHALYVHNKIMLVARQKSTHTDSNGIWIATDRAHHASLAKVFPTLDTVAILINGQGETNWRLLHEGDVEFEKHAVGLCELIKQEDPRIGTMPKPRKPSKRKRTDKRS